MAIRNSALKDFLKPLGTNSPLLHQLVKDFCITFRELAADSHDQFLPTPVFESTLRPCQSRDEGVYLAIDIGGSNLRVAFVELFPAVEEQGPKLTNGGPESTRPHLRRLHEKAWPIEEHLKNEQADQLFGWIGTCITQVVRIGKQDPSLELPSEIPMGVTFSFPMVQDCLSHATLMSMGKGFAITSDLDLGYHLVNGYEINRGSLPPIRITAILNDSVATMASFMYQNPETDISKPAMGLILGTGCNATIPMKLSSLHESKRKVKPPPGYSSSGDAKIAINTEWSIKGSVGPMKKLGLITRWDKDLDDASELPGFQPFEYMTAGRYLGELCRLIFVEYLTDIRGFKRDTLPQKIKTRFGISTTFLSYFRPNHAGEAGHLRGSLEDEFGRVFPWTEEIALDLYEIAVAVEHRAAFLVAAAIVGLLQSAGYIPPPKSEVPAKNILVGYTGGCITKFQMYLVDTRRFIDQALELEYGAEPPVRIALLPCHDGGIEGAGILAGVSKGY
ncbi:Hexokinase-1 [Zalerion maritima]|uniref:Phosphotransferase n=1 Tax=Zalerion maritima TaxID=339359 RepID=A0AAD5S0I8_9PEZI|nr:Hexokinase-1 [Zalerion maritima]